MDLSIKDVSLLVFVFHVDSGTPSPIESHSLDFIPSISNHECGLLGWIEVGQLSSLSKWPDYCNPVNLQDTHNLVKHINFIGSKHYPVSLMCKVYRYLSDRKKYDHTRNETVLANWFKHKQK